MRELTAIKRNEETIYVSVKEEENEKKEPDTWVFGSERFRDREKLKGRD